MMNARLLVALVFPVVWAASALPESPLSAEQDSTIVNAAVGVEVPTVVSTIAFTSTRDNYLEPWALPPARPIVAGEIYFIDYMTNGTFSAARGATSNTYTDIFPTLSPDGRGKVVFDSNRLLTAGEPGNTSDLFLMNHDGTDLRFLTGRLADLVATRTGRPSIEEHRIPRRRRRVGCRSTQTRFSHRRQRHLHGERRRPAGKRRRAAEPDNQPDLDRRR